MDSQSCNNDSDANSKTGVLRCLICAKNVQLLHGKIKSGEVSEIYSDLLAVLCKYMKWTIPSKYRFDFTHDSFPFCGECILSVVKLYKLHEELKETRGKINDAIIGITGRILLFPKFSSVRKNVDIEGEGPENAVELMDGIRAEEKCEYYRSQLYRRFTPSVQLLMQKAESSCSKKCIDYESGVPEKPVPIELNMEDPIPIACADEYQNVDIQNHRMCGDKASKLSSSGSKWPSVSNLFPELSSPLLDAINFGGEPDCSLLDDYISGRSQSDENIQDRENLSISFPVLDQQTLGNPQLLVPVISPVMSSSKEVIDSNSKLNVCETCGNNYSSKSSLQRHQLLHTGDRLFCCELCGKCFKTSFDVRRHKAGAHFKSKEKKFACEECGQKFERILLLTSHRKIHEKTVCFICGQKINKSLFKMHILTHRKGKAFTCFNCNKSFKSCWQFNNHLKNHGRISASHMCDICGKKFANKFSLQRHQLVHTDERPFHCDLCGKSFKSSEYMKRHNYVTHLRRNIRSKRSIQNFARRPIKSVNDAGNLDSFHYGKRNMITMQTGQHNSANSKLTSNNLSVNSQVSDLVYSSDSIFECPICEKSFASYYGLHQHSKVHATKKPFPCELCTKKFSRRTSLIQHEENVHGEKTETDQRNVNRFQCDREYILQSNVIITTNPKLVFSRQK